MYDSSIQLNIHYIPAILRILREDTLITTDISEISPILGNMFPFPLIFLIFVQETLKYVFIPQNGANDVIMLQLSYIPLYCGIYPAEVLIFIYLQVYSLYLQDYCIYLQNMQEITLILGKYRDIWEYFPKIVLKRV